ncbi:MAG: hypothetical protein IIZ39_08415 [Blautia sp.]|nr:hypothetical protein [Blautia sp.]
MKLGKRLLILLLIVCTVALPITSARAASYHGAYRILSSASGNGTSTAFVLIGKKSSQAKIQITKTGLTNDLANRYPSSSKWYTKNTRYKVLVYDRNGRLWKTYQNLKNNKTFKLPKGAYRYRVVIVTRLNTKSGYVPAKGKIGPASVWSNAIYSLWF